MALRVGSWVLDLLRGNVRGNVAAREHSRQCGDDSGCYYRGLGGPCGRKDRIRHTTNSAEGGQEPQGASMRHTRERREGRKEKG